MSFLAPWFLLGVLAVAGPVLFHLVRRTTRQRVPFSSLLFLRPAPPRLTRRNRLEHLLLLALRCLVIVLLAAGFARPYWQQLFPAATTDGPSRRTVLLVDTSASLRRAELWAQALNRAEAVLRRAAPADEVAVLTFDRAVTPRLSFEEWAATPVGERAAVARARLAAAPPGWAATHLDTALIRAAELAAEPVEGPADRVREVVVITDLQSGARTAALQGHEWPRGVTVRFEPLRPPVLANASLHWVPEPEAPATPRAAGAVRVRVVNAPDSRREQFQVGWVGTPGTNPTPALLEVYVPPGQSRVVTLAPPTNAPPAGAVRLEGDEEPFDNLAWVAPPQPLPLRVVYLGHDAAGDPRSARFFLERAFPPTTRRAVQVLAPDPANLTAAELESAALAVVTVPLHSGLGAALRPLLARGRTVLWVPPDAAAVAGLAALVPGATLTAADHRPADYALLTEPDYQHPLLAPFADPRYGDFSKIRFWRYRRLDLTGCPQARVLARFDSGDPALVEIPAGRGRVQVWAAGWAPADSQLALSTKFVPLLHSLLDLGAGPPPGTAQYAVGDALPLPEPGTTFPGAVMRLPDGTTRPVAAGATQFESTALPGLYELTAGEQVFRWAVNLDPAESRLTPLPVEDFERLGVPLSRPEVPPAVAAARLQQLQAAELEGRQKLWRWLLLAALGMLGVETFLAGRAARRRAMLSEVTP
jgi:hypothetical protein